MQVFSSSELYRNHLPLLFTHDCMTVSDPCQIDLFWCLYHYRCRCTRQVQVKIFLFLCAQLFQPLKECPLLQIHKHAPLALSRLGLFRGLVELPHRPQLFFKKSRIVDLEVLLFVLLYLLKSILILFYLIYVFLARNVGVIRKNILL